MSKKLKHNIIIIYYYSCLHDTAKLYEYRYVKIELKFDLMSSILICLMFSIFI